MRFRGDGMQALGIKKKCQDKNMRITDQPGRVVAILVIAPALFFMGWRLKIDAEKNKELGSILIAFAIVFFVYELFWITRATKVACI